ncbi:MAG: TlpA disulfide reductase family protein [Terracidiphilus sp.]
MASFLRAGLCAALLVAVPFLRAQVKESTIEKEIRSLRSASTAQRPVDTIKIAQQIQTLPAGKSKVADADALSHLVTEGDQGDNALQAVADTLTKALAESPVPAKGDQPPMPYRDLARLVYYERVTTTLNDPLYTQALKDLDAVQADIQKADFTLKDLHNKKVTLSELRGKIVLVNFWATWCVPCRQEMGALDRLYTYFQPQGLVVLSITDENGFQVSSYLGPSNYHPPVLLDPDGNVHKLFHVEGIPESFLFDRDGKLLAVAIDQCTQHQFLKMLDRTDLHP